MNFLDLSPLSLGPIDGERQPGISSYLKGKWVHGSDALSNCRLDPQSTLLDVWENLSLDPITPSGGMRHRADLAVAQVTKLNLDKTCEWCVAVPMGWTKSVVQLFLGVAKECDLTIAGCVPRALVVADLQSPAENSCSIFEWGWKALYVGKVTRAESGWTLDEIQQISEAGITPSFRRESKQAAAWMLEQHRVDPLHSGSTEQDLFTSWWSWHSGSAPEWEGNLGKVHTIFSENRRHLQDLHRSVFKNHDLGRTSGIIAPHSLVHLTGCEEWSVEPELRLPDLDQLQMEEGKGPRWREVLLTGESSSSAEPGVTHVVIDGIAEPVPQPCSAKPGDVFSLEDGREGLAIYVPEN